MTTDAGTDHLGVINSADSNRYPGRGTRRMAGIALIAAVYVRHAFSASSHTVVTANTGTRYLAMIHGIRGYRDPGGGSRYMTGITGIRTRNVGR